MRTSAPAPHVYAARLALIVIALVALVLLTGCSGGGATPSSDDGVAAPIALEQVNLEGTWVSTGDLDFEADISPVGIEVYWKVDATTSGLYWKGTMPNQVVDDLEFTSDADAAALETSIFGSSEPVKTFTYADETLSFDFEAMGVKHTINLERK